MFKISLAAARVNAGLTQLEVARIMKKSNHTIMNWENGKAQIDYANLSVLCELYGIPPDYINLPSN